MNDPGVITGVFSCTEVRNEKLEVRTKRQETRIKTGKIRNTRDSIEKNQDIPPN
jgi:hypothetical protein